MTVSTYPRVVYGPRTLLVHHREIPVIVRHVRLHPDYGASLINYLENHLSTGHQYTAWHEWMHEIKVGIVLWSWELRNDPVDLDRLTETVDAAFANIGHLVDALIEVKTNG